MQACPEGSMGCAMQGGPAGWKIEVPEDYLLRYAALQVQGSKIDPGAFLCGLGEHGIYHRRVAVRGPVTQYTRSRQVYTEECLPRYLQDPGAMACWWSKAGPEAREAFCDVLRSKGMALIWHRSTGWRLARDPVWRQKK